MAHGCKQVDDFDGVGNDDDDDDNVDDDGDDDDDDNDDDDGYPANSPHDKIPPWWEYVIHIVGAPHFVFSGVPILLKWGHHLLIL